MNTVNGMRKQLKFYLELFVCMSVKAGYLKMLTDIFVTTWWLVLYIRFKHVHIDSDTVQPPWIDTPNGLKLPPCKIFPSKWSLNQVLLDRELWYSTNHKRQKQQYELNYPTVKRLSVGTALHQTKSNLYTHVMLLSGSNFTSDELYCSSLQ